MINAIVAGAAGRMGQRIIHMIAQQDEVTLSGAFERLDHPSINKDAGSTAGLGELGIKIAGSLEAVVHQGDVLIDFTTPDSTIEHMRLAAARKLPMVIGTTGMTDSALKELKLLSREIPCVFAPNMSMGVNVMFKIAADMARILGKDYDMEILETHHRQKVDAPSGTAVRLAEIMADSVGWDLNDVGVFERKGLIGKRSRREIGIQTWRAGDIVGEHTVMFGGIGERLELTHRAHNRDNFARGAVRAAVWLMDQPEGLYDMQDVLGLR